MNETSDTPITEGARPHSKDYTYDGIHWHSDQPGWTVMYPTEINGNPGRDVAFVASTGYGTSDFIHFHPFTGEPYGFPMTARVRRTLIAMRAHYIPARCADRPLAPPAR